jgi:hypothetical protein
MFLGHIWVEDNELVTLDPPIPCKEYATLCPAMNYSFLRGTIVSDRVFLGCTVLILCHAQHCTSADPSEDPEFDARYFEQAVGMLQSLRFRKY